MVIRMMRELAARSGFEIQSTIIVSPFINHHAGIDSSGVRSIGRCLCRILAALVVFICPYESRAETPTPHQLALEAGLENPARGAALMVSAFEEVKRMMNDPSPSNPFYCPTFDGLSLEPGSGEAVASLGTYSLWCEKLRCSINLLSAFLKMLEPLIEDVGRIILDVLSFDRSVRNSEGSAEHPREFREYLTFAYKLPPDALLRPSDNGQSPEIPPYGSGNPEIFNVILRLVGGSVDQSKGALEGKLHGAIKNGSCPPQ